MKLQPKTLPVEMLHQFEKSAKSISSQLGMSTDEFYKNSIISILKKRKNSYMIKIFFLIMLIGICLGVGYYFKWDNVTINISIGIVTVICLLFLYVLKNGLKETNLDILLVQFDIYDKECDKNYIKINIVNGEGNNSDEALINLIRNAKKIQADAIINLEHKITSNTNGTAVAISTSTINHYYATAIKYI